MGDRESVRTDESTTALAGSRGAKDPALTPISPVNRAEHCGWGNEPRLGAGLQPALADQPEAFSLGRNGQARRPRVAHLTHPAFRLPASPTANGNDCRDPIAAALSNAPFATDLLPCAPRPATDDELALVHTPAYLERARRGAANEPPACEPARLAAGGVIAAVDATVAAGGPAAVFCAVRPPGHHASADRARGLCRFNNVAIAARHAQRQHGLDRVLILDWDAHHGDGTAAIFAGDPSVL